jgi:predicted SAM-dependent methyltransferase
MSIRAVLRRSYTAVGLARDICNLREFPRRARAKAQVRAYVGRHAMRKLQLGCGRNILEGWLNTDLCPCHEEVVFLDASQPFPIGDETFDFVFSEHLIEHLTVSQGRSMLRECCRILRPGGAIRVATPDLRKIVGLLDPGPSNMERTYLEWSTRNYVPWAPVPDAVYVVNNFFRDWGHQFIYDEATLRYQLHDAGFVEVHGCRYSESETPELRGVETHAAATGNEAMMVFETMILQARKPELGQPSRQIETDLKPAGNRAARHDVRC